MPKNFQLQNASQVDVNRLVFKVVDASRGGIPAWRVQLSYTYDDGSVGPLIISTSRLYSFGFEYNKSVKGDVQPGYKVAICLEGLNSSPESKIKEAQFIDKVQEICEACKDYVLKHQNDLGRYGLERAELKSLDKVIYRKRENGKVVPGKPARMYPKLIEDATGNVKTQLKDLNNKSLDLFELLPENPTDKSRSCYLRASIKFDSLYAADKISLITKLYAARVEMVDNSEPDLVPPTSDTEDDIPIKENIAPMIVDEEVDENNEEIIEETEVVEVDENEEVEEPVPEPTPKKKSSSRRKA